MGRLRARRARHRTGWTIQSRPTGDHGRRIHHRGRGGRGLIRLALARAMRRRMGDEAATRLQTCEVAEDEDNTLLRFVRKGRHDDARDSCGEANHATQGGRED